MSQTEKRNLGRVRYWQGQMLRSHDFNDIHAIEEQRRWWHNRAVHDAYGIHQDDPKPFTVTFNAEMSAVIVAPGMAYDSSGRELILQTNQTVPLPALPEKKDEFLLLLRYRTQNPNEFRDNLAGACYTDDVPTRHQLVEFTWKRPGQCSFADGVPLKKLVVDPETGGGKPSLIDLPNTPFLRPLSRPQLGSGSTVPGNTPWELWTWEPANERGLQLYGVQTTIDTSAAGFTDAPCYFAWLQGNVFNPQTRQLAVTLFTSIAEESVNSFIFRIALSLRRPQVSPEIEVQSHSPATLPQLTHVSPADFALFARKQNLYVNWTGCQKNASAPLALTWVRKPGLLLGIDLSKFADLDLKKIAAHSEMPE